MCLQIRKLLRDDQWNKLEPLLPGKAAALGNWHTTYTRFKRWGESGVWPRVVEAINDDRDLEALMIDSTAVRAHQHAAGAQKKQALKRSAAEVTFQTDERLREKEFGIFDRLTRLGMMQKYPELSEQRAHVGTA
jgi:transposase